MFGSIRLGTILGIPVGVNWTVLLIAWLIAFSLAAQLLPAQVPGLADAAYWVAGAAAAALFFGSLLAHELSHAVVARREGLKVSGITLWLLGGVATMKGEARTPGAEARIAGVGPLTSFLLAVAFGAAAIGLSLAPASDPVALAIAASGWLSLVNLVLAVFNLLPGAPLDGGRIARAIIWRWRRDKMQATRWSTGLGQVFGYGLAGIGVLRIAGGDLGGAWFLLLGFFLSSAAGAERRSSELLETLRGVSVGDIMTRDPLACPGQPDRRHVPARRHGREPRLDLADDRPERGHHRPAGPGAPARRPRRCPADHAHRRAGPTHRDRAAGLRRRARHRRTRPPRGSAQPGRRVVAFSRW